MGEMGAGPKPLKCPIGPIWIKFFCQLLGFYSMGFCIHEALEHFIFLDNYLVSLHSSQNLVPFHLAEQSMLSQQFLSNSLKLQILHFFMLLFWCCFLRFCCNLHSYNLFLLLLLEILHKQYGCLHHHLAILWLWPLNLAFLFLHCNLYRSNDHIELIMSVWHWKRQI